ncbi:hypothetical protein [Pedobacter cryoconitis]|uniref:hypothetical protein n=1 Tax=Pedobacter cryoconitis TaxID=188932 RepID=UPI00160C741C|nr:hypothetical protein [Pedobacter cryoconitis]MBB5644834.1 hypothetical protein [Pedobacter cryoconitis]
MKKILQISSVSLLAIGLIFGRYIGRWLVNIFDNPDTGINDGHLYINQYLSKCDTITLNVKNFADSASYFEVKAKFNPSSADNMAIVYKHEIKFYSDSLHKYFSIFYFFKYSSMDEVFGMYLVRAIKDSGGKIIATVNKQELADSTYGTKEKPIPIVYFRLLKDESYTFYSLIKGEGKGDFPGSEDDLRNIC